MGCSGSRYLLQYRLKERVNAFSPLPTEIKLQAYDVLTKAHHGLQISLCLHIYCCLSWRCMSSPNTIQCALAMRAHAALLLIVSPVCCDIRHNVCMLWASMGKSDFSLVLRGIVSKLYVPHQNSRSKGTSLGCRLSAEMILFARNSAVYFRHTVSDASYITQTDYWLSHHKQ